MSEASWGLGMFSLLIASVMHATDTKIHLGFALFSCVSI